jgi:predicted nuclease of predicted toxin-antitoxin system
MKFFFDNNLSEKLTRGMKAFGEDVVHLKEIFPGGAPDPEWLKYVGNLH